MASIYELTADYQQLMDMADDPEVDANFFADTLEGLEGEIEAKAESYACVMKNLDSEVAGLKAEIERLTNRKRTIENNITRMKAALQQAMEVTGKTKFKTNLFSFNVQNNPVSVFIPDENRVPVDFQKMTVEVDKAKIKDWLKEGNTADWAELTQSQSLRIR